MKMKSEKKKPEKQFSNKDIKAIKFKPNNVPADPDHSFLIFYAENSNSTHPISNYMTILANK